MKNRSGFPVIVDTTLRDGVQMPGTYLNFSQKKSILGSLYLLGITEAEIGCTARGTSAINEMRRLCGLYPEMHCSAWCRARKEDIDAAAQSGVDTIHISFPVSHRHMKTIHWSVEKTVASLYRLVTYAQKKVNYVTIGAQDATRADPDFLKRFIFTAVDAGAKRIRIADTVGIATPCSITELIETIREACPEARLEFHGHNDFGLATAVTLAAIESGTDAVSVTVQGVGERAGNAALEEVITAAEMLYGYRSPYLLRHLSSLCTLVADCFHLPDHPRKAITGRNAFRHESGIHCHGMLRDKLTYQPFHAETVGRVSQFTFGPQSGSSGIEAILQKHGLHLSRSDARTILKELRETVLFPF